MGECGRGPPCVEVCPLVSEAVLNSIEASGKKGLSSQEILTVFADHGVQFSEATLRKYVQLGLLPRSVRVGEKGKHRGSRGLYPVRVVRQILLIKQMMAQNFTIPEIKEEFLFLSGELEELEATLGDIFSKLGPRVLEKANLSLSRDAKYAESAGKELVLRLRRLEERLRGQPRLTALAGA